MYLGRHLILDLQKCQNIHNSLADNDAVQVFIDQMEQVITSSGLHVIGGYYHFFGKDAVTFTFLLKESHVNIHTWPELYYVSSDIYVCNYQSNKPNAVEVIADAICAFFKPQNIDKHDFTRSSSTL